ncbi:hypothetical protein G7Y89_g9018 [Cudoniella acicularis]|uniref:ferric-chelate reductase (NADPH) n=1 Tax=Cudoniella acicularis TaxID=354080 RepID=A0A8H4W303_9HELO|nr:hypothetical protein G7Y89_g9018 [Cudoniella acicularis]
MSLSSRHDHDSMGGMMTMAPGVPGLFYMQQIFWAFVGTAIAVAAAANVINKILYHQRISSLKASPNAAKPRSFFFQAHATMSAMIREFGYYSMPLSFRKIHIYLPPAGPSIIMVAYLVLIVVCCFYRLYPNDFLQWEDIGYRSGFIAVCQMPLIVLLAGKQNIIGFLTGVGYERLNWLHRWVARALLFTVLIHFGYWMTEWAKYDYILIKIKTDSLTQYGIAAGSVLAWLVLSSVAPIRGLSYEVFVVQHVMSWLGFVVALYFHLPDENRIWIWIPLGFWAFDRLLRALFLVYNNLSVLHKNSTGFLACKATFELLDESHTRITIPNPPITWKAGQHLFLACYVVAPLSAHPFTISSLPEDGKLEFVVRAKKGATKRFFKYAEKTYPSLPAPGSRQSAGRSVLIDGPYSRIRPLRQFDSLVLLAGSTGVTFTMPLMREVVQQWMGTSTQSRKLGLEPAAGAVTRHIRFIWVVKRKSSINWFASQLDSVVRDVEALRNEGHEIAVERSIYITCDDVLTSGRSSIAKNDQNLAPTTQLPSGRFSLSDEKKDTGFDISEVASRGSISSNTACCCNRVVTDEDTITAPCNCATRRQRESSSTIMSLEKTNSIVDPRISLLAGRPHVENIIRKTAELALGEMAVVVCGPPGLVQGTRNSVVKISDDRAVHKGTEAQGIYVHAETFGTPQPGNPRHWTRRAFLFVEDNLNKCKWQYHLNKHAHLLTTTCCRKMALSVSSFLLILYVSCETIRANYAYYAFHNFPQISASLIALLAETFKLAIAVLFLLRANDGFTVEGLTKIIRSFQPADVDFKRILKYALPAALYLANNLIYYTILPKTSPSLLQVCVLAKLPTTGILHHYMIKPQRNLFAWVSLGCLCLGLVVFNIPSASNHNISSAEAASEWYLAPVAGFVIACLSALASIATETSTKTGEFWESQAYLYIWGMFFAIVAYPLAPSGGNANPGEETRLFDMWSAVFGLVVITSGTGLVVAVVLRARDNILKVIGTAASLITIAASQFILLPALRASTFTPWKVCGGGIVTVSTWCYNHYSQEPWGTTAQGDIEVEALLNDEEGEVEEKSNAEGKKPEVVEEENASLKPNVEKIVGCAVIIAFVTYEVALRV